MPAAPGLIAGLERETRRGCSCGSSPFFFRKSKIHCVTFQRTPRGGDAGGILKNAGNQEEEGETKNGLGAVPGRFVRRSRKGLWYSVKDIPLDRIRRLFGFVELAPVAG